MKWLKRIADLLFWLAAAIMAVGLVYALITKGNLLAYSYETGLGIMLIGAVLELIHWFIERKQQRASGPPPLPAP